MNRQTKVDEKVIADFVQGASGMLSIAFETVKGEAGKELVETVKQVYQATESWGGFGRGHGGRR